MLMDSLVTVIVCVSFIDRVGSFVLVEAPFKELGIGPLCDEGSRQWKRRGVRTRWIMRLSACFTYGSFLAYPFRYGSCEVARPNSRVGSATPASRFPPTASLKLVALTDPVKGFDDAVTRPRHHPMGGIIIVTISLIGAIHICRERR